MPKSEDRKKKRRAKFLADFQELVAQVEAPRSFEHRRDTMKAIGGFFDMIAASDVSLWPLVYEVIPKTPANRSVAECHAAVLALVAQTVAPHLAGMMAPEARQRRTEHPEEIINWQMLS